MYSVLKYIHDNITEKISVTETAQKFGYSKWHFIRRFKSFTGKSFVEYVRYYKMQNAAMDIQNGEKIINVSNKYGYDTPGGFNKAFLKEFGALPREYKNRIKEGEDVYRERRNKMYKLSDRCEQLRKIAVETDDEGILTMQKEYWFTKGMASCLKNSMTELTGAGMVSVMQNSLVSISEGELIVGYNYTDKYDSFWDDTNIRLMQKYMPEKFEEYLKNLEIVKEKKQKLLLKDYELTEKEKNLAEEWAVISRCITGSHSVIGYENVLKFGFEGLLKKIEKYEKTNGPSELYSSAKEICKSACLFGKRYADRARQLIQSGEVAEEIRNELEQIAENCDRVPAKPARTFWEALQSLWFAHIFNTWEDRVNANSLGRLDQILYPYYKKDIEEGRITKEFAFELICCLWIKLYRSYDVQQSALGGCKEDGTSAVNDLSFMMLDATEELDFIRCLSVRYDRNTDREFVKRSLEVVGHLQKGVPFFFNDEVMIPSLVNAGIEEKDARNYTQLGCVETTIPGKSNPHAVTGEVNFLKALEYTLGGGRSLINPDYDVTCKTESITSFEDLKKEVYKKIEEMLNICCKNIKLIIETKGKNDPKPYKSLLTEGCLETNRDFNDKGALYDYYQVMFCGIPNLADSLVALNKFVFSDKKYTLEEIVYQLKEDFPDEIIRLQLLNKAPKFGNDIDEVDEIACEITEIGCDILERMSKKYGMDFHAQPFTFWWMIDHGKKSAASPDGRRKGEPIAYSVSPMQGRDFSGFTALLNSLCKLPAKRTPGTTSAIVEVDPKLFTDENIESFVDIMIAASEKGISNVQFNVVDENTLIEAQKFPDKYNNLAVRVSGFSQKFNQLGKGLQDHIIGRTKHRCM